MTTREMWTQLSSAITGLMLAWVMLERHFPYQLRGYLQKYSQKLMSYVYPYIHITFHEFTSERLKRSEAFSDIQNYIGSNSPTTAKRLKAEVVRNNQPLVLTMDDYEEVTDVFDGVKVWWSSSKTVPKTQSISFHRVAEERRQYRLLRGYLQKYNQKLMSYVYPYIQITFHEFTSERLKRSEAFSAIQNYMGSNSTKTAKRLKAEVVRNNQPLVLTMDDYEEVTDVFDGVKVWWSSSKTVPKTQSISFHPVAEERRQYRLTFHKRHREVITEKYIEHVLKEGKAIAVKNRQRKLFTNNSSENWYGWKSTKWSHAWKRGYLLYGPPGTGKSTMISAMANFLDYDIYDLELTTVKDNSELRRLLIETTGKSIIVIEDIDCSLDLTGQRKKTKEKDGDGDDDKSDNEKDPISKKKNEAEKENKSRSKVTLSGLLNFIDGIWSACGGERIIVFTTNYVDRLDPALIRTGRMDKHIELSYCCFEAFKVLAKNYLELKSHELFGKIEELLGETKMSPADVAENLMPKSDEEDEEDCLKRLIKALETTKEEARKKAEEAVFKAEKAGGESCETPSQVVQENGEKSAKEVKENGVIAEG
ncbi:hypothetical protein SADUNF_Sadunf04G0063500 [Salix dunnii]|uniref:AAA+ ATPase domain-containing protein n=1 Tax=Salix dunnii TaxID=1413687 RepID=A0A835N0I7_9ROSI|nr:hypothetical protein SADUNF_Sadunf04G0063500 [Salix dunnii]